MSNIVTVGRKQIDLDKDNPLKLIQGVKWLGRNEPDTPANREVAQKLIDQLYAQGYDYTMHKFNKYTKQFMPCNTQRFNFSSSSRCILKQGHTGEHFSRYESGNIIYWD